MATVLATSATSELVGNVWPGNGSFVTLCRCSFWRRASSAMRPAARRMANMCAVCALRRISSSSTHIGVSVALILSNQKLPRSAHLGRGRVGLGVRVRARGSRTCGVAPTAISSGRPPWRPRPSCSGSASAPIMGSNLAEVEAPGTPRRGMARGRAVRRSGAA
eukprot:scaffold10448_cov68-Phaeocystis_antarctica.AAC.11